jgi:hypothetical protein
MSEGMDLKILEGDLPPHLYKCGGKWENGLRQVKHCSPSPKLKTGNIHRRFKFEKAIDFARLILL